MTEITALVSVQGRVIAATPYQSSGTAYSQFTVIQISGVPPTFEVSRRSDSLEDNTPEGYVEPTTPQK